MTVREPREPTHLARIEPGSDDLQGRPTSFGKAPHQLLEAAPTQPITGGMREHRVAPGIQYPAHSLIQARPLARNIGDAAASQETLKGRCPVTGMPLPNEPVGDMHPAHNPLALENRPRIAEACLFEGLHDGLSALQPLRLQPMQGLLQTPLVGINPEPDDMHSQALPCHRQLDTWDKLQTELAGSKSGFINAVHRVVVGDRKDAHPGAGGVRHEHRGLEFPVRPDCMCMQIVVHFCVTFRSRGPMIPIPALRRVPEHLPKIERMLLAAWRPQGHGSQESDPTALITALEKFFTMLADLDDRYGEKAPLPDDDATRLGDTGLLALVELIDMSQQLGLEKAKAELELLAVSVSDWIMRHKGEVRTLEPIVNGLAVLANELHEPASLEGMTSFMADLMSATAGDIAADPDKSDERRPWRILQLNRAIVATRSYNTELMSRVFDDLIQGLPGDAKDFFREGMRQMEVVNYPARVRAVMTHYFEALALNTLH